MSTPSIPGNRGPDSSSAALAADRGEEGASRGEALEDVRARDGAASPAPTVTWARGQLAAWWLLSLVYLLTTATQADAPAGGTGTRLLQYAYGAGHFFALGAVVAGAVFVWRRLRPHAGALQGYLASGAAAFVVGWPLLAEDLVNLASRMDTLLLRRLVRAGLVLAIAASIPLSALVGRALGRAGLRPLAIALGATCASVSCFVAPQAYFGLHLFAAVAAATMIGVAIAGATVPVLGSVLTGKPRVVGLWTVAALWGAWSIVEPPPAPVLFELFRTPGAVVAPFIAPLHVRPPPIDAEALDERWPALAAPPAPAPPSAPALLPEDGVVVVITVDCLRAGLFEDNTYSGRLPNLTALRDQSVSFTQARTTAASTVIGLSALFTGKYQSQLAWREVATARGRRLLPAGDPSVRFPSLLSEGGVATVTFAPVDWLSSVGGIVAGFREEEVLSTGTSYAFSKALVDRALPRLEKQQRGPLFLFLHFLDAHAPYDLAGTDGPPFERYLREVELVDAQIGRVTAALSASGLADRAALILTADHGEAFGEHHTSFHRFTAYEELVRVPLFVRVPGVTPRTVTSAVSLVDVGPTVLDLFRMSVPPSFAGRSLLPALRGAPVPAALPRAIESELHQALVFEDGFKIIRHKLRGTVELYDLPHDPAETHNLFHEHDTAAVERLGTLGAFFDRLAAKN